MIEQIKSYSLSKSTIACIFILALAVSFRFGFGLRWDMLTLAHPDERFLISQVVNTDLPNTVSQYLDEAHSPLNPLNRGASLYVYGTLPILIAKGWLLLFNADYGPEILGSIRAVTPTLRALTLTLDIACVAVVMWVTAVTFSSSASLFAGFFLATATINIQTCRFFTVDPFALFFLTCTFATALRWIATQSHRWVMLGALAFAAAVATKLSMLLAAPVLLVAYIAGFLSAPKKHKPLLGALFGVVLCLLFFRILSPYTFATSDIFSLRLSQRWIQQMLTLKNLQDGAFFPPSLQWIETTPILYSLQNLLLWSPGLAFLTATILGILLACNKRSSALLYCSLWVGFIFCFTSSSVIKPIRYFLPLMPAAATLIGVGLEKSARQRRFKPIVVGLCILQITWTWTFTSIYRNPFTRGAASEWFMDNIPCGTTIALEHWDEPFPLRTDNKKIKKDCYNHIILPMYDDETDSKRAQILDALRAAEYIILSSHRVRRSVAKLPNVYPMTEKFYEDLFAGKLGFSLINRFTSYPGIGLVEFKTDSAEESLSIYDHPPVMIFRKTDEFNYEFVRSIVTLLPHESLPTRLW